jgi:hypothetical protein
LIALNPAEAEKKFGSLRVNQQRLSRARGLLKILGRVEGVLALPDMRLQPDVFTSECLTAPKRNAPANHRDRP